MKNQAYSGRGLSTSLRSNATEGRLQYSRSRSSRPKRVAANVKGRVCGATRRARSDAPYLVPVQWRTARSDSANSLSLHEWRAFASLRISSIPVKNFPLSDQNETYQWKNPSFALAG